MTRTKEFNRLNAKQIHILKLVYKFRYMTAPLLTKYKGLNSRHAMYMRLEGLVAQGYLAKRVESNKAFSNKGARYYLTNQGLKLLRDDHNLGQYTARALQRSGERPERFIDHHIDVLRLYLTLDAAHPNQFNIFTRTELLGQKHFPNPLPDLYLQRIDTGKDKSNDYLLYGLADKQLYEFKKDFPKLLEHLDSGIWEKKTERPYPVLVFVCADSRQEFSVEQYTSATLESAGIDDLIINIGREPGTDIKL